MDFERKKIKWHDLFLLNFMCYAFSCVGSIVIVETPILTTVGIITTIIEALVAMAHQEAGSVEALEMMVHRAEAWAAVVAVATHFDGKKY